MSNSLGKGSVVVKTVIDVEEETFQLISVMNRYGDICIGINGLMAERGKWNMFNLPKIASAIECWNIKDTLYLRNSFSPIARRKL